VAPPLGSRESIPRDHLGQEISGRADPVPGCSENPTARSSQVHETARPSAVNSAVRKTQQIKMARQMNLLSQRVCLSTCTSIAASGCDAGGQFSGRRSRQRSIYRAVFIGPKRGVVWPQSPHSEACTLTRAAVSR
jgi:hypothetical protein